MRKQLYRANRAFAVLQRRFRERRKEKEREKAREKEDEERKDALERRMIHNLRSSMRKQMKMLESLPAREVNQFMVENQVNAATRIQAGYRGMLARREAHKLRIVTQQHRAATVIQRQVRLRKDTGYEVIKLFYRQIWFMLSLYPTSIIYHNLELQLFSICQTISRKSVFSSGTLYIFCWF